MDVILIKDNHLGKKYEIVKVKGGFARNFLIPNGIAIYASEKNRKEACFFLAGKKMKEQRQRNEILKIAKEIQEAKWELMVNTDSDGNITDKITTERFVKMIKDKFQDCKINAKSIILKDKICNVGVVKVNVKLQMDVLVEISVNIKKNI